MKDAEEMHESKIMSHGAISLIYAVMIIPSIFLLSQFNEYGFPIHILILACFIASLTYGIIGAIKKTRASTGLSIIRSYSIRAAHFYRIKRHCMRGSA